MKKLNVYAVRLGLGTPDMRLYLFLFTLLFCVVGCSKNNSEVANEPDSSDPVVARVDDTLITLSEVNRELEQLLGENAVKADMALRQKLIDSMVQRRAVVLAAEKELTAHEQQVLSEQLAQYHDNELMKRYMRKHTQPQPITEESIKDYYQANLKQFGGVHIRQYQMLIVPSIIEPEQLSTLFQEASQSDTWATLVESAKDKGLRVRMQEGRSGKQMLHKNLRKAMDGISVGQISEPINIGGNHYLIRIVNESEIAPRPLGQVRQQIREILAGEMLKQNVKEATKLAMKKVRIEIMGEER